MYDPLVVDVFLDMRRNWVSATEKVAEQVGAPYQVPLAVPIQPI